MPQVAPEAQLVPDTQTDRLTVWALPHEHAAIDTQLKSLEYQLQPADLKLATYTLQRASTAEAQQLLQSVIPDLQFLTSADPQQLLIRARPQDHTLIQQTLDELDQVLSQPQATEVKVYSLGSMAPTTLTPLLDPKLTAGMSVIPDAERKALVVRGTAEQHIELKAAIDEILTRLADAPKKVAKVYRFQHADPAAARLTLLQLLPTSAFVVDLAARSLTANALPTDHERIDQIIQQLDQPPNDDRETVVYRLKQGSVYALLATLQSLLPEAVFGVDRSSRTLVATASPTDQQQIREVVQQMDDPEFRALETRVYRVQMRRLYSLRYSLNSISPDAVIVTDEDNGLLVATASPADHEKIQAIIEQLNASQAETRVTKVYHFQYADPASIRLTLSQMLPRSLLSIDLATKSLIANASPEDQLRIDEMVKQLDQPVDDGRETAVYRLQEGDVTALLNSLESLLPTVAFGVDRSSRTLIATATPEEQQRISAVVQEMDDPEFSAMETKVYRVEMGELYSLRYALRSLSREAIIVTDEENGLLVATASPADQKKISAVITQLNDPEANQRETKVYRLQAGELYGVRQALRSMLPRASISVDDENRAILVTASTEDHARVKQVLDELDSPDADTRQTKVYRLQFGDVYAAQSALEALLPQAVIAADRSTRALVATASSGRSPADRHSASGIGCRRGKTPRKHESTALNWAMSTRQKRCWRNYCRRQCSPSIPTTSCSSPPPRPANMNESRPPSRNWIGPTPNSPLCKPIASPKRTSSRSTKHSDDMFRRESRRPHLRRSREPDDPGRWRRRKNTAPSPRSLRKWKTPPTKAFDADSSSTRSRERPTIRYSPLSKTCSPISNLQSNCHSIQPPTRSWPSRPKNSMNWSGAQSNRCRAAKRCWKSFRCRPWIRSTPNWRSTGSTRMIPIRRSPMATVRPNN